MQRHTTDIILLAIVMLIIGHLSIATAAGPTRAFDIEQCFQVKGFNSIACLDVESMVLGVACKRGTPWAYVCDSEKKLTYDDFRENNVPANKILSSTQRAIIIDGINSSTSVFELGGTITAYLEFIGEIGNAHGESYEQTANRLDDDIMRLAVQREKELKKK